MKRAFDTVCAAAGLILLSPLFAAVALAIKLYGGRGPIFYLQPRVGKNAREFLLVKFRTMVRGADRHGVLTAPEDPRVTVVGRFLRKHKLDEFPQLINVVKGDMRLVGPRPEVRRYVDMFRGEYDQLLQDPPGITDPASLVYRDEERMLKAEGLEELYVAQILPHKLRLSLAYSRRRTFISDLKIVLQTLRGSITKGDSSSGDACKQFIDPLSSKK
jgi:lipopolysaccharide/colanic/teichoic acid biosynthesis glycosyltransferase